MLATLLTFVNGDDINRQSIVFYDETPDVFYCPQDKPVSLEGKFRTETSFSSYNFHR